MKPKFSDVVQVLAIIAFVIACIVAARVARAHYGVVVVMPSIAKAAGGAAATGGGTAAAAIGGTAIVGGLIYIDVKRRTRCNLRHDTWTDGRSDAIPTYRKWRDHCKDPKRKRVAPVVARG